jgi:hypothetical protein
VGIHISSQEAVKQSGRHYTCGACLASSLFLLYLLFKEPTHFYQAWVRIDANAQSTAAYIVASETLSLAVYAFQGDCAAVVLDAGGGVCASSPRVSTCHCGPRVLEDKVRELFCRFKGRLHLGYTFTLLGLFSHI